MNKVSGETVRAVWYRSQRQEGLLRSNTARRERLRIDRDDFVWKCSNNRALSHQRDRHVVVLTLITCRVVNPSLPCKSFYSNGYRAPVPEVLTTPVGYHAVVLRRNFRDPRGEVCDMPPATGEGRCALLTSFRSVV
ncbi:hypothetical protein B296_00009683 [Ensete ventricosum]|uniref:Uncharacterized protein n=1 Tax=Ensete ventricosum TaxID=4639 RepID=A0A427B5N9_ENSVE|nr:hypothetical protein B296_00009683 [Ensete ventricosum]